VIAVGVEAVHPNKPSETVLAAEHALALKARLSFSGPAAEKTNPKVQPAPVQPMPVADVMRLIGAAASKHNVPPGFVQSIVAAESNFDSTVVSPKGAIGLMQLMPETAKMYGADPSVPDQNVDAGTHYLRVLMDRYKKSPNSLPRVIAAYNAGPGMVDKYRGIPPFRETRNYVVRVMAFLGRFEDKFKTERNRSRLPRLAETFGVASPPYFISRKISQDEEIEAR
jgi:soluble lytic murein transglycosylase-like protein